MILSLFHTHKSFSYEWPARTYRPPLFLFYTIMESSGATTRYSQAPAVRYLKSFFIICLLHIIHKLLIEFSQRYHTQVIIALYTYIIETRKQQTTKQATRIFFIKTLLRQGSSLKSVILSLFHTYKSFSYEWPVRTYRPPLFVIHSYSRDQALVFLPFLC